MLEFLKRIGPQETELDYRALLMAAGGALILFNILALLGMVFWEKFAVAIPLIAPLGGSAVFVYCAPNNPLAKPWNVVIGNVSSALVGVACARYVPYPEVAAGLAAFVAIIAMVSLRALHPPGGAVALTAVLGGEPIQSLGYLFAINPVLILSIFLVCFAALYQSAVRGHFVFR
jgi:CBS domain-containing membrane protein